jgi:hypothetical protein
MSEYIYTLQTTKKEQIDLTSEKIFSINKTPDWWEGFYIYQLVCKGKIIFEYLGQSENELACWVYEGGIFYRYKDLIGYYRSGLHLQRKADTIINISSSPDQMYLLEKNRVLRFHYKSNWKSIGLYKLPTKSLMKLNNLQKYFSIENLRKNFLFGEIDKIYVIVSFLNIGIIKNTQITQIILTDSQIIAIKNNKLEAVNKFYYLSKKLPEALNSKSDFKPSKKTLLCLSKFTEIRETVDLFFIKFIWNNLEKKLSSDWHLEPLDRGFLSSEAFYQEKLYDYLQRYLSLTVQGLYLTNPDALLMLQEALREQEGRIYADGHIQPDKTLASLITSSLPLPSSYDTTFQSNIRSLFLNSLK